MVQGVYAADRVRSWSVLVLAVALACSLMAAPAAAQEAEHDPTEPDRPASSFAAYPGSSVGLSGITFGVSAIDRLDGATRYHTAVLAAQRGWPAGSDHVVIAPGEGFGDALAASPLAGALGAPLLLAGPSGLDADTAAELQRLAPQRVHLVGAVPTTVVDQVAPAAVEVLDGGDVHATSVAAAHAAVEAGADPGTVIVASATSFADSLASSALAAGLRHPLLLVGPEGFTAWLTAHVQDLGAHRALVVGGQRAIPDETVSGVPGVTRLAGSDRTATALAVADHARAAGMPGPPVVVSGVTYADGLAGGVLAGISHGAPLLLAGAVGIDDRTATWLAADGAEWVRIMGGTSAVDPVAECQLGQGDTRSWFCAEGELQRQGYNTGTVDGRVDAQTVWATYAFEKVAGLRVDGHFGEEEFRAMLTRPRVEPRRPDLEADHVEVDIGRQLVLVVRGGQVVHQLHTSSGKSSTPTVIGTFRVYEKRNYRQANRMYRPVFFHGGYAFHGYPEVPLYPASAGCARMYDGDMDFLWDFLYLGEQITTYR